MSTKPDPLPLCRLVQGVDDRLGKRSDHEGDEAGPTHRCWVAGKELFDEICDEQIYNHNEAIKIWKRLKKLNAKRP